jgi:predicted transposase YdaD
MPVNVHDLLFRATFSQVEHAASILRLLLPPALVARIDWSTLTLRPGSFVDEALAERFTDLLFSVMHGGRRALVYLVFEHQSSSEPLMALRMLRYEVRIWDAWLKENPHARRIPAILPVVLHHSLEGWTATVAFEALLDVDEELLAVIAPYVPRFHFILDDISAASDEDLRGRAMTALGRLVLWCFRHARTPEEFVRRIGEWVDLVREVRRAPNGAAALKTIYRYMMVVTERYRPEELTGLLGKALGEEGKAEMASVADQLREEGERKGLARGVVEGRLEGRRELVLKLLRARFGELPEVAVARVNAADVVQLDLWAERVLSASTLADVLESD